MCVLKVAQEENNVFPSFNEAQIFFEKLKKQKMKKGYA